MFLFFSFLLSLFSPTKFIYSLTDRHKQTPPLPHPWLTFRFYFYLYPYGTRVPTACGMICGLVASCTYGTVDTVPYHSPINGIYWVRVINTVTQKPTTATCNQPTNQPNTRGPHSLNQKKIRRQFLLACC